MKRTRRICSTQLFSRVSQLRKSYRCKLNLSLGVKIQDADQKTIKWKFLDISFSFSIFNWTTDSYPGPEERRIVPNWIGSLMLDWLKINTERTGRQVLSAEPLSVLTWALSEAPQYYDACLALGYTRWNIKTFCSLINIQKLLLLSQSLTIKWNLCQINDRGELLLSRPSITAAGANAVQTSQGSSRDKEKRIRNCIQSSSQSPDSHTVISNPIPFNLKTDVWKYLPFPGGLWINNKPVSFELKFKYFISK